MDRTRITRVSTLYEAFAATPAAPAPAATLAFAGVDGCDVYNIAAPFRSAGRTVIAGRVERRDSEESTAVFFEERDGVWHPVDGAPTFRLQDPFVTYVGGDLVFGGVETWPLPSGFLGWRTVFHGGPDIFDLRPLFAGPTGMKDVRLCELADGRVGVFTRPRGTRGGRGTIGYAEADTPAAITAEMLDAAPMIEDMFHPLDWGGVNEAHLLASGEIGVLAHIAHFDDDTLTGQRRYYAAAFTFDPATKAWRDYRIIAARDAFPPGPAKRDDLVDVVFPSGLVTDGAATRLYAGLSDAGAGWVEVDWPFDAPPMGVRRLVAA